MGWNNFWWIIIIYTYYVYFHYGELERELQRKPFTTYIKMFKVAELVFFTWRIFWWQRRDCNNNTIWIPQCAMGSNKIWLSIIFLYKTYISLSGFISQFLNAACKNYSYMFQLTETSCKRMKTQIICQKWFQPITVICPMLRRLCWVD